MVEDELSVLEWGTVMLTGTGWSCFAAVMGSGMLGGGTIVPLWNGVAVLSFWFITAKICKEMCLWLLCGFGVWNVFGEWKLGQVGSLSSDTT